LIEEETRRINTGIMIKGNKEGDSMKVP